MIKHSLQEAKLKLQNYVFNVGIPLCRLYVKIGIPNAQQPHVMAKF